MEFRSAAKGFGREDVFVGFDNSNIFIAGQAVSARKKQMFLPNDLSFRIDAEKLIKLVLKDRQVGGLRLYGSGSAQQDSVWEQIRKVMEVDLHQRSSCTGREKEVDASLVADLMEDAATLAERNRGLLEYRPEAPELIHRRVYAIVGGDRDYVPLVRKILNLGFAVEIYSWRHSMCADFYKFLSPAALQRFPWRLEQGTDQYEGLFSVYHLDSDFGSISFSGSIFNASSDRFVNFPGLVIVDVAYGRSVGSVSERRVGKALDSLRSNGFYCEVFHRQDEGSAVVIMDKRTSDDKLVEAFELVKCCVPESRVLSLPLWTQGLRAGTKPTLPHICAEDSDLSTCEGSGPSEGTPAAGYSEDQKAQEHKRKETSVGKKDKKAKKDKKETRDGKATAKRQNEQHDSGNHGVYGGTSMGSPSCLPCDGDGGWRKVEDKSQQQYLKQRCAKEAYRHKKRCSLREFCPKEFPKDQDTGCTYNHTREEILFFQQHNGKTPFIVTHEYVGNIMCKKHDFRLQGVSCKFRHQDDPWCCFVCLHFNEAGEASCKHCMKHPELTTSHTQDRPLMVPGVGAIEHFVMRTGRCYRHGEDLCRQCLFGHPLEPKPRRGKQAEAAAVPSDWASHFAKVNQRKVKGSNLSAELSKGPAGKQNGKSAR